MGDRKGLTLRQVGALDPLEVEIWDHYYASFDPLRPDGEIGKVLRDRLDAGFAKVAWAAFVAGFPKSKATEKDFMSTYVKVDRRAQRRRKKETAEQRDARVADAFRAWCGV